MDSRRESGSGAESDSRVLVAQYFWEEYKYRHDLIWRLLFRVTGVAVALSIAPFGIEELVVRQVGRWVAFLPVVAVLMIVGSFPLFRTERRLFREVLDFYRKSQNKVLDEQVHIPKPSLFDWLVPLYLGILLSLSLIVSWLVWFKWYPSL
jgi:hypothetical protein